MVMMCLISLCGTNRTTSAVAYVFTDGAWQEIAAHGNNWRRGEMKNDVGMQADVMTMAGPF